MRSSTCLLAGGLPGLPKVGDGPTLPLEDLWDDLVDLGVEGGAGSWPPQDRRKHRRHEEGPTLVIRVGRAACPMAPALRWVWSGPCSGSPPPCSGMRRSTHALQAGAMQWVGPMRTYQSDPDVRAAVRHMAAAVEAYRSDAGVRRGSRPPTGTGKARTNRGHPRSAGYPQAGGLAASPKPTPRPSRRRPTACASPRTCRIPSSRSRPSIASPPRSNAS
jgi:hypothetical protein